MTAKELLRWGVSELRAVPIDDPEVSAEFLLRNILGENRAEFFANLEQNVSSKNEKKFKKLIDRRKRHEPVWQILGKVEFCGLDFFINQNVLTPRPETEFLVEEVLKVVRGGERILDVGTGAGPIPVALAKNLGDKAEIYASDVSKKALLVAKMNAKANNVLGKIRFKSGSLLEPWKNQKFDMITANLPYIPNEDLGGLALEIHHYEPRLALDGGEGGLVLYEEFMKQLPEYLNENAKVFCEIGKGQGKDFCKLVKKYLPTAKCTVKEDLAKFDRIAIISL